MKQSARECHFSQHCKYFKE